MVYRKNGGSDDKPLPPDNYYLLLYKRLFAALLKINLNLLEMPDILNIFFDGSV